MSASTEERVDIVIVDRVSDEPAKKVLRLAEAARSAHDAVNALKADLAGITSGALGKLQKDMLGTVTTTTKAQAAVEKLNQAQARTDAATARAQAAQERLNNVTAQGAILSQRLTTEMQRSETQTLRTATARERLQQVQDRARRSTEQDGAAMVKLYEQLSEARAKVQAIAAQAEYNSLLGVGIDPKSARASAAVFKEAEANAKAEAKALADLQARTVALKSAIDPAFAAQEAYNRTMAEASALLKAGTISEVEYARAQELATAGLQRHAAAQGQLNASTKLTRFQLLTLQYTVNDVIASLASGISPMTILMQQGGQVTQAWGGVTNTFKALGAALTTTVGLVASAVAVLAGGFLLMDHARGTMGQIQRDLDNLGGSAGMTAGQFLAMGDRIGQATRTSVSSARDIALAWLKTGDVQGVQLEQLTTASINFARQNNEDADKVVKDWQKMAEQPSKFVEEFMKAHGQFTSSEYAHILLLEQQGDKEQALAEISQKLYNVYGKTAPEALNKASVGWTTLKVAASDAWDAIMRGLSGDKLPVQQQLADAQRALDILEKGFKRYGNEDTVMARAKLQAARDTVANLQEQVRLDNRVASERAMSAQAEKDGADAAKFALSVKSEHLNGQLKLNAAMAQYDKATQDAARAGTIMTDELGKQVKVSDYLAQHRADYLKDETKKLLPQTTAELKKQQEAEERLDLAVGKVFDGLYKEANATALVSEEREKANKIATIDLQLASKKFALNEQERAQAQALIALIFDRQRVEKAAQSIYEQSAQAAEKNYKAQQQALTELYNDGRIGLDEYDRSLFKATEQYKDAIDPLREYKRGLEDEQKLLGLVGDEHDIAAKMIEAEAVRRKVGIDLQAQGNEQLRAEIELQVRNNFERSKSQQALNAQWQDSVGLIQDLKVKTDALTQAYNNGWIGLDKYNEGLLDIAASLAQLKIDAGEGNFSDILLVAVKKNYSQIEDALTQLVSHGKADWKSLINSMIEEVMRLAVVKPAMSQMLSMMGLTNTGAGAGFGGVSGGGVSRIPGLGGFDLASFFNKGGYQENLASSITGSSSASDTLAAIAQEQGASGVVGGVSEGMAGAGASAISSYMPYVGSVMALANKQYGQAAGMAIGTAIMPGIGTVIGAVIGSIVDGISKSHGPKDESAYNYTFHASDKALSNQDGAKQLADAINTSYSAIATQLGVDNTKLNAGVIYAKDPNGTAMTQLDVATSNYSRGSLYGTTENVGRTDAEFQVAATQATEQAIIKGLVNSNLSDEFKNYLNGIDIKSSGDALAARIQTVLDVSNLRKALAPLGSSFENLRSLSIELTKSLIDAAGGVDNLSQLLGTYYDNFFTDEEKRAATIANITNTLDAAGATLTQTDVASWTRQAFRAFVEGIDVTTDAGQRLYVAALGMAGAVASITDPLNQVNDAVDNVGDTVDEVVDKTKELRDNVDKAFDILKDQVNKQKDAFKTALDQVNAFYDAQIDALNVQLEAAKELKSLTESTLSQLKTNEELGMSRAAAEAQLQAALVQARAGNLPTADSLRDAMSVITRPSADQFSSFADYIKDFDTQAAKIAELDKLAGNKVSDAQRQIDAINDAKKQAQAFYDKNIERLDSIIDQAQAQIDALNGVNTSIQTLGAAIANFNTAMQALLGPAAPPPVTDPGVGGGTGSTGGGSGGTFTPIHYSSGLTASGNNNGHAYVSLNDVANYASQYGNNAYVFTSNLNATSKINNAADTAQLLNSEGSSNNGVPWTADSVLRLQDPNKGVDYWNAVQAAYDAGLHPTTDTQFPGLAVGTNLVPKDMVAQLHQGEAVIPKEFNPAAGGSMYGMGMDENSMAAVVQAIDDFAYEQRTIQVEQLRVLKLMYEIWERWDATGLPGTDSDWVAA